MKKLLISAAALSLVTACADGGGAEAESELQQGRWDISTEYLELAEVERPDELDAAMGDQQNITQICIDEKEAAKPSAAIFAPEASEITCQYEKVNFSGGKVEASASCLLPGVAERSDMVFTGTYTKTSYQTEWKLNRMVDGEEVMSTGTLSGSYSGAC